MPPLLAALPGLVKLAGRLKKPSARYGGPKGPLLGTVDQYLGDIQLGGAKGLARLQEMWQLRRRDGAAGWGAVWNELVRGSALPASVRAAAEALDPGHFTEVTKGASKVGGLEAKEDQPAKKKPKPERSSSSSSRAARAPKVKKVARYDPDTGRRVMVAEDSEEALTWPNRKPSKRLRQLESRLTGKGISELASGAKKMTAANARLLARAGVIIGGLAAGYFIGSALNKHLAGAHRGKQEAAVAAALAFREAREEAAAAKGAALTAAEVRSLGDVYKAQLIALGYKPGTFTKTPSFIDRFFLGQGE
jgi:hypothetical protein